MQSRNRVKNVKKIQTRAQAETSRQRGINFVRYPQGDDERADELEDETLEEWAERKGVTIENPSARKPSTVNNSTTQRRITMGTTQTRAELQAALDEALDRIDELEAEREDVIGALGLSVIESEEVESDED